MTAGTSEELVNVVEGNSRSMVVRSSEDVVSICLCGRDEGKFYECPVCRGG